METTCRVCGGSHKTGSCTSESSDLDIRNSREEDKQFFLSIYQEAQGLSGALAELVERMNTDTHTYLSPDLRGSSKMTEDLVPPRILEQYPDYEGMSECYPIPPLRSALQDSVLIDLGSGTHGYQYKDDDFAEQAQSMGARYIGVDMQIPDTASEDRQGEAFARPDGTPVFHYQDGMYTHGDLLDFARHVKENAGNFCMHNVCDSFGMRDEERDMYYTRLTQELIRATKPEGLILLYNSSIQDWLLRASMQPDAEIEVIFFSGEMRQQSIAVLPKRATYTVKSVTEGMTVQQLVQEFVGDRLDRMMEGARMVFQKKAKG